MARTTLSAILLAAAATLLLDYPASAAEPVEVVFDAQREQQEVLGFGAQIWGYNSNPNISLKKLMQDLNIGYIRICRESASWNQLKSTWHVTNQLGVKWVLMSWRTPQFEDQRQLLSDREGFAQWWANEVQAFHERGMPVPFIELMNEPDSNGEWSTGIPPETYNDVVKRVRRELDRRGFSDVGIVGPGLTHLNWNATNEQWFAAMDEEAVRAHSAWSSHTWDDGDFGHGGANVLHSQIPTYIDNARAKDPDKPLFITEYATKETTFHGKKYPHADRFGGVDPSKALAYYSVTASVPYAARVYENTLALLNSGIQVPFLWQLNDEPSEVYEKEKSWGMVDLEGRPKPVYKSLGTLLPEIPAGARVLSPPEQDGSPLYAAAFVADDRLVVAVANDGDEPAQGSVRVANVSANGDSARAIACRPTDYGSIERGEPGAVEVQRSDATVEKDGNGLRITVELPPDSTLTVVVDL